MSDGTGGTGGVTTAPRLWVSRAARAAYALLLRALLPAYALRLWWRGAAEPLYRHAIGERFGFYAAPPSSGWLWLHAVSLGETRAAAALVDALRAARPSLRLLLTHGTATGREAGAALLRAGDVQAWLPYDTPGAARRFLRQFRPALGVLMETEVWPQLLFAAQAEGVPVVLANARLSAKSFRQGQRIAALMQPAAHGLACVLAQTEADAQRLRDSGARHVAVCGNLKYDLTPPADQLALGRQWRARIGRPVVLAAITREGEEAVLLPAWARLVASLPEPKPLLLIVPRHPQRFDDVARLIDAAGLTLARRSAWVEAPTVQAQAADVWLGDSMGEMALYYASANVALLGGSFARLGGQNLIEAAACGCPVVMGPHTFNFAQAAELALAAGAAIRVTGIEAGLAEALALSRDLKRCDEAVTRCLSFAAQHRGAAARMAVHIDALMSR